MVDEQFRRPGSEQHSRPAPPRAGAPGWQPDAAAAQDTAGPPSVGPPGMSVTRRRRPRLRAGFVAGCAALLVGVAGGTALGVLFARSSQVAPVPVTPETFPLTVLGQQRDDLRWPDAWSTSIQRRLDDQFRDQVESYRFAYGGDGATLTYGSDALVLTIVNGHIPNAPPTTGHDQSAVSTTVVTLESDGTSCVSEEPPLQKPQKFELSEILDDDSKDVFFWLEEGRTRSRTVCVLFDRSRNLSLRLSGPGWVDSNLRTARSLRDELVDIHVDLTS